MQFPRHFHILKGFIHKVFSIPSVHVNLFEKITAVNGALSAETRVCRII